MSIVFFGTPDFATASLEAIVKSGRKVVCVVTQPDRPAGRGRRLLEPSTKKFAREHGIPVLQPVKLREPDFLRQLREAQSKLFVVAAYGRILPTEILSIPELILNVHASLLPKWRGAAPIARSILAGERKTGISIMRLVKELDAGDVLLQKKTDIGPEETCGELTERLAKLGGETLLESLRELELGSAKFVPQDSSQVTIAPQVRSQEGTLDWNCKAVHIHNQVRAFNPWPGTVTSDEKQRIKIWRTALSTREGKESAGSLRADQGRLWVAAGDGWLEILELQREGKARQAAQSFVPGYPISAVSRWR